MFLAFIVHNTALLYSPFGFLLADCRFHPQVGGISLPKMTIVGISTLADIIQSQCLKKMVHRYILACYLYRLVNI